MGRVGVGVRVSVRGRGRDRVRVRGRVGGVPAAALLDLGDAPLTTYY